MKETLSAIFLTVVLMVPGAAVGKPTAVFNAVASGDGITENPRIVRTAMGKYSDDSKIGTSDVASELPSGESNIDGSCTGPRNSKGVMTGSCSVIGPRHIILSAHELRDSKGNWSKEVTIIIGGRSMVLDNPMVRYVDEEMIDDENVDIIYHEVPKGTLKVDPEDDVVIIRLAKDRAAFSDYYAVQDRENELFYPGPTAGRSYKKSSECGNTINPWSGNGGNLHARLVAGDKNGVSSTSGWRPADELDWVEVSEREIVEQDMYIPMCLHGQRLKGGVLTQYRSFQCGVVGKHSYFLLAHNCPTRSSGLSSGGSTSYEDDYFGKVLVGAHVGAICEKQNRTADGSRCKKEMVFDKGNYNVLTTADRLPLGKILGRAGIKIPEAKM